MLLLHKLKFLSVKTPCKLVGPTINKARKFKFDIDGNQFSIKLPRYSSARSSPISRNPKPHYNLDGYHLSNSIPSKDGWGFLLCAGRAWDFYGPSFSGKLGTVSMTASVITPRNLIPNTSFFHPRVFEKVVADYLTHSYEDFVDQDSQDWLAPSCWKPISKFECVSAKFKILSTFNATKYEIHLALPFSNTKLFLLNFILDWHHVNLDDLTDINRINKEQHDISNMEQLCDDIMDSLEVKLSVKALAQQQTALAELDDTSLISD